MLCATLGDVRACGSSKNCCDANTVGHADDTGNRVWINFISNDWVARDTPHVAFSKPRARTVGHLSQAPVKQGVEEPANAFGQEPREATRNSPPTPRHWCVQHSSLLPSSDPRPLCARKQSHVKKRTQSHDLQFPDRSICSRCRWRKISASGSERCDTTSTQTVHRWRIAASTPHAGVQSKCGSGQEGMSVRKRRRTVNWSKRQKNAWRRRTKQVSQKCG